MSGGAPWFNDDGDLGALLITSPFIAIVQRPDQEKRAHTNALYLGRGATVCPAAMGWASAVLSAARGWRQPIAIELPVFSPVVRAFVINGWDKATTNHVWGWGDSRSSGESQRVTIIEADAPDRGAPRLRAVLEYEMERA